MAKAEDAKPRPKPTGKKAPAAKNDKPQSERFIEIARKNNADESGETFEKAFSALVPRKSPNMTP